MRELYLKMDMTTSLKGKRELGSNYLENGMGVEDGRGGFIRM